MATSASPAASQGDPHLDADGYRRCLGEFGTGVTVMTAEAGGRHYGMTANSFASVSLDPPLVLWSVKRASQSFAGFAAATRFAVNVLAAGQTALSRHFGRSGEDKFSSVGWRPGLHGTPVLDGVAAAFECRRVAAHDGGDHLILVGEVDRFTRADREVLLFVQGRYCVAREHPEAMAGRDGGPEGAAGPANELIAGLMYRAYGALAAEMERLQRLEGLDPVKGRLMGAIATYPGRTLDDLSPELFLGLRTARFHLAELRKKGLVAVSPAGELELTAPGQARLKTLIGHIEAMEAGFVAGLAPGDVAAARRLLRHLIRRGREAAAGPA